MNTSNKTMQLTVPSFCIWFMQMARPSLVLLKVSRGGSTGDKFPRGGAAFGNALDGQTIGQGEGGSVGFRKNGDIDSGSGRRHRNDPVASTVQYTMVLGAKCVMSWGVGGR